MEGIKIEETSTIDVVTTSKRFRRDQSSVIIQTLMPEIKKGIGNIPAGSLPYCAYSNWSAGGVTVEAGLEIAAEEINSDKVVTKKILGGKFAVKIHTGHFNELPYTHAELEKWIENNGYKTKGLVYEFFLVSPEDEPDPSEWKVKVMWELA